MLLISLVAVFLSPPEAVAPLSPPVTVTNEAAAAAEARSAFAEGLAALDKAEFARAEARFRVAATLVPDWGLAHLQLGIALFNLDPQDPRAAASLEHAVALDAGNARAHLQLGLAYDRLGRANDAVREVRAAISLRPDLIEGRYLLAGILAASGADTDAIETYGQVLERAPGHIGALAGLAACYERTGQNILAETALLTIARLYPDVSYHRYRLAEFYERIGAREKAARIYGELESSEPRTRKMRRLPTASR